MLGLHGGVGVVRRGHINLLLWNCLVSWLASNYIHLAVLIDVLLLPWLHVYCVLLNSWIHTRGRDHVLTVIVLLLSLLVHVRNFLQPFAPNVLDNADNRHYDGNAANDRNHDAQDDCGPVYITCVIAGAFVVVGKLVDEFISLSNDGTIERVLSLLRINLLQS